MEQPALLPLRVILRTTLVKIMKLSTSLMQTREGERIVRRIESDSSLALTFLAFTNI